MRVIKKIKEDSKNLNRKGGTGLNEFIKVCKTEDLKEKEGKRVMIEDVDVAIFKVNGKVHALNNVCPHQKAAMIYDGFIEEDRVVCPLHGWEFNLSDGTMAEGRRGLDCYEVKIENGDVYVKVFKRELKW